MPSGSRTGKAADHSLIEEGDNDFLTMPGHLLRRCHQISVAVFLDQCRAFDLTPLQFGAMAALDRFGPMDQVRLGGVTALDRTTVVVVIGKLEERGLIHREPSDKDKRAKIAALTAAGRQLLDEVMPYVEQAQDRMLDPLNRSERARLRDLLKKMADGNNALSRAPHRLPDHAARQHGDPKKGRSRT